MASTLPQPISPLLLTRILMVLIVLLAFVAGYYHSAWQVELQKNNQLQLQLEEKQ